MKKTKFHRSAMMLALSLTIAIPQMPMYARAAQDQSAENLFPFDLFGEPDSTSDTTDTSDTGLVNTTPVIRTGGQQGKKNGNGNNNNTGKPNTGKPTMRPVSGSAIPESLSCPLFENKPHAELITAIDALTSEVRASQECSNEPSVKSLQDNGKTIKESISAIETVMATQDPNQVNTAQIDQTMTSTLQAVSNVGDILNNNAFLNSKCGRQTMSTGKVLLAFNDVINGIAPYALFAVSMNAALAPALPFVIGGVVATAGISAMSKMIDANTLDMTIPEHRKAVLQNTCQFTKVAKKVRFMQLAQSGKIDKITQELEKDVALYKNTFSKPSGELSALLKYKDTASRNINEIEKQLASDRTDLATVESQITQNNDDLMVCTMAQELVNWSQDGRSFPASVFNNLDVASSQANKSQRLQAITMKSLNMTSLRRISELAPQAGESEAALRSCAQAARSWITGIRQSLAATASIIGQNKIALENELNQNMEYRSWKVQYNRIQVQKITVQRVGKAMQELAKDNSIIDRSELAQRMMILKSGLFGVNRSWSFGKPPVLAWIDHTRTMHSQSVSAFLAGVQALKSGSWSLTDTGQGKTLVYNSVGYGYMYQDPKKQVQDAKTMKTLGNFTLEYLPLGSRENELVCQQLEGAWLDWSAAMDHLGAIQFFCDMIDPVLDVKMDASVVTACRGNTQLNGRTLTDSYVNQAKKILINKGYQAEANLVSSKLKELQCPVPAVSVMNQ
ncbi:hypothetical protein [Bdellovibrio svalbardensis]|uniref:Uncharacterized protein n=1 Tax=Bdellovibrio svalbardensis TaxID=2972972 RepID=A0ABT6DKD9_9BACT|nr:hypothetical protein [Bdellovibrio svalbardensis]MDG0817116.1 hypothetical protein [Bdellovibrio svalbardensis]